MSRGIKIALPGYNALTDTNPNHFSLYVDQDESVDYTLIKELTKQTVSVTSSLTVPHNLGYVPLVFVFAEVTTGVWRRLFSRDITGFGAYYTIDGTNLELYNSGGPRQFAYHIFLDNITSGSAVFPNLGQHMGFKVAKRGVNAQTATDPNDFVFHSDFNTFKIIVEATKNITLAASTNDQIFTEPHNQKFVPLMHAFAKESALSQVFLPNSGNVDLWGSKVGISTSGVFFNFVQADSTNMIFSFSNSNGTTKDVSVRYFVLEKVT